MQTRYVDADELWLQLDKCESFEQGKNHAYYKGLRKAKRILSEQPTADVAERKRGKWIDGLCCSECGWVNEAESGFIREAKGFNFCPNCGAEMEKADETPPKVYECDPNKNTECTKESCFINGGPCFMTVYEEFKKEETDD